MRDEVAGVDGNPGPVLEVRSLDVPFGMGLENGLAEPGSRGGGSLSTGPVREEGVRGLRDISFSVGGRERFALVGASGVGKTSLLQVISGFRRPSKGRVLVEGRDVTKRPPEDRDVVFLTQRPVLFPHLSVFENVAFPLRVRKVPRDRIFHRVEEALRSVRLEGLSHRRPGSLSGGQAHRVALARAVVARPRVLLLDEPLTSLDPALRGEVRQAVLSVHREYGPALVLVTHDLEEAGRMADRVGLLLDGRLEQVGPPAQVFRNPGSVEVARFLGLPNEMSGTISPGGVLEVAGWMMPGWGPALRSGMESGHEAICKAGGEVGRLDGNEVILVFGFDAGQVVPKGASGTSEGTGGVSEGAGGAESGNGGLESGKGGLPGLVAEVHHHPHGATARVILGRQPSAPGTGEEGQPEGASAPACELRVDPVCPPEPGSRVEVRLYRDRIHVFTRSRGG